MPQRAPDLSRCAVHGAVVGTIASAGYAVALLQLAMSAADWFACIAVQPMDPGYPWEQPALLEATPKRLIHALPDPETRFLPRTQWCGNGSRYGWRRSHVYKMLLWRTVLEAGFHLLSLDCDWHLRSNPLPRLRAAHVLVRPPNASTFLRFEPPSDEPADFVALLHDGMGRRQLNIGVVFIRANERTVELARATLNRSYGAHDQQVVNEELNWGLSNVSCCFVMAPGVSATYRQPLARGCEQAVGFFAKNATTHNLKNVAAAAKAAVAGGERSASTGERERTCVPAAQIPPASRGPPHSPITWAHLAEPLPPDAPAPPRPRSRRHGDEPDTSMWEPRAYNTRTGVGPFGRCTRLDNACGCGA